MNSRQRRKQEAKEHNARPALLRELKELQCSIHAKHGAWVKAVIDSGNSSVLMEIARLRGVLEAEAPPPSKAENRRKVQAGIALAYMVGMVVVL